MNFSKVFVSTVVLMVLVQCVCASMPVLSGKSSLRFGQITSDTLADNSVSASKLQAYSVGKRELATESVDSNKIASDAIFSDHFTPNAVTTRSAAIDIVTLHLEGSDPYESPLMNDGEDIPVGPTSVQPFEAFDTDNLVQIDLPDVDNAYIIEGKARGPGVILGWYPARNGHLLRYQHARSLRGLVCADVGLGDIDMDFNCNCYCRSTDTFITGINTGGNNNDFINGFPNDNDSHSHSFTTGTDDDCNCACDVDHDFHSATWVRDLGTAATNNCGVVCTSLEDGWPNTNCVDPNGLAPTDPACNNHIDSIDNFDDSSLLDDDMGGEQDNDIFDGIQDDDEPIDLTVNASSDFDNTDQLLQPEACSSYTSVEDVNNPQEGVPNYAPSLESITIDDTGVVSMRFFGHGGVDRNNAAIHPDIDIIVVVLLDEQFGA